MLSTPRSRSLSILLTGLGVLVLVVLLVWSRHSAVMSDGEMFDAIRQGDLSVVERYLARGGNPNRSIRVHDQELTLLKAAILDREEAIALALLSAGADVSMSGVAMWEVATNGMTAVLRRLLPLFEHRPIQDTGVSNAAGTGYYDSVEVYLLYADLRPNEWARELNLAAGAAMFAKYDDVARLLLESGADLHEMLHVAARFSSPGMVRYLLARGMDPMEPLIMPGDDRNDGRTPTDFALRRLQEETILHDARGITSADDRWRESVARFVLFELTRAGGNIEGVDLEAMSRDGLAELNALSQEIKLVEAARWGFIDVVEDLLAEDAPWATGVLREAVIAALEHLHDDVVRVLLDSAAPVDGGVLHSAAAVSSPGMVRHLLRSGGNVAEIVDNRTPLRSWFERARSRDPEFVLHELIVAGADACWLVQHREELPGYSAIILRDSAPYCWER